ncbi:GerAB/ArcD/ProY family transporter [Neobacillus kokaensis]|uniref:Spore germination protein KB n=1 Tax=Neobacillus kokaensis TaxID=2759023 RepID=A0ABQ3MYB8_9BACI|nr:endospore germination permease [Neobacillus kokaensis]GHH96846.1 spore germination protein KB [Neobacillus kokaensis]
MEKAKISAKQLFVLVVLFEMGSAILVGFPLNLKQDAWVAVLLGMAMGVGLFFVYYRLFLYFPDLPLTSYLEKIIGKWPGRIMAYFYILYFAYLAARVLRDFGELLTSTIYTHTPLFFLMSLMIITNAYAIQKGFEVIARVGELFFVVVYLMAIGGFFLIIFSGLIHLENLKPVLESDWIQILKTTFKGTLTFPFGEMVVFTMLLPYLNQAKKAKLVCISGMILSGINFTIATIINITTLGIDLFMRSPYPLLSTISRIQLFNFIERLDVLFMIYLMIAGFIKVAIFYYAAVAGTASLFQFKDYRTISLPIGILILLTALMIASNYTEHIREGLDIVPIYLHWPLQIIVPCLLLVIAFFRNRRKQSKEAAS